MMTYRRFNEIFNVVTYFGMFATTLIVVVYTGWCVFNYFN